MESVSLYSEARNEYLKQLSTWVVPPLVEFFRKEYDTISSREGAKKAMNLFQAFCSEIPRWNQDVIDTNIGVLLDTCKCDYIEDLMTAVFIAHTKMLTAIRVNSRQKKLQITLPKLDHFLHRVFVECARSFWKAPFLFSDEYSPIERQKNVLQAEAMCTEALSSAVRSLLPVKSILRDYLEDDQEAAVEEVLPSEKKKSKHRRKDSDSDSESSSSSSSSESEDDSKSRHRKSKSKKASKHEEEPPAINEIPAVAEAPHLVIAETPAVVETVSEAVAEAPAVVETVSEAVAEAPAVVETVSEAPAVVASEPAAPVTEAPVEKQSGGGKPTISIEKLDTPPTLEIPHESAHSVITEPVENTLSLTKEESVVSNTLDMTPSAQQQFMIETEPTVHFTPYDTVFDETTSNISEIRYSPKISVEDKPDVDDEWGTGAPKLNIGDASSSIGLDDIEDLDAPKPVEVDIDIPLTMSNDFEELAP